MRRILPLFVLSLALAAWAFPAAAQKPEAPEPYQPGNPARPVMHMYQVVLASRGPHWVPPDNLEGRDIRAEVIEAISRANTDETVTAYGMIDDDTDVEFMMVLDLPTKAEAEAIIKNAKGFKDGIFKAEIHSWFATELD